MLLPEWLPLAASVKENEVNFLTTEGPYTINGVCILIMLGICCFLEPSGLGQCNKVNVFIIVPADYKATALACAALPPAPAASFLVNDLSAGAIHFSNKSECTEVLTKRSDLNRQLLVNSFRIRYRTRTRLIKN